MRKANSRGKVNETFSVCMVFYYRFTLTPSVCGWQSKKNTKNKMNSNEDVYVLAASSYLENCCRLGVTMKMADNPAATNFLEVG